MSKEPPKQAQEKTESFKEAWNRGIQEANKQEQERREKEGRYRPLNWKEGAIILIIGGALWAWAFWPGDGDFH